MRGEGVVEKGGGRKYYLQKAGLEGPKLTGAGGKKGVGRKEYLLKEGLEGPKLTGGLIYPEGASHDLGPVAAAASAWGAESYCV